MPLANHVSGTHQDLSGFADVEGNLLLLLVFVALSWTLAALVEELAFRGYLLTRMREALGAGAWATVVAVLASSLLFGSVHSEQGAIGVLVVSLDAVAFSVLRLRYRTSGLRSWPTVSTTPSASSRSTSSAPSTGCGEPDQRTTSSAYMPCA